MYAMYNGYGLREIKALKLPFIDKYKMNTLKKTIHD